MNGVKVRLFVVCGLVTLINFFLFCACGLSLLRVLQAAARDAYSSPRRRLLALDDGGPRRSPSRIMAVLGAFRPFTTQKALLSMLTLSAACEFTCWVPRCFSALGFSRCSCHLCTRAQANLPNTYFPWVKLFSKALVFRQT